MMICSTLFTRQDGAARGAGTKPQQIVPATVDVGLPAKSGYFFKPFGLQAEGQRYRAGGPWSHRNLKGRGCDRVSRLCGFKHPESLEGCEKLSVEKRFYISQPLSKLIINQDLNY